MELSYWEYKSWLSNVEFTIVGSGIVGLTCAIHLKERFPKSKVLILEKGTLPQGASTKNAGFTCFGSISEILSDLKSHSDQEVQQLVLERLKGIQLLRKTLGDSAIDFKQLGGHEIFLEKDEARYEECLGRLDEANELLMPIFGNSPFHISSNQFGFKKSKPQYITHQFEGQLDTGKMMSALLHCAQKKDIRILNNVAVESFQENGEEVLLKTKSFEFKTTKLFLATNGFAKKLLNEQITPARAQVLITKPIENLKIEGTFHFDQGYFYFRNIDDRILFGGGRNLDFKSEETTDFGQTTIVQNELERLLSEVILPNTPFEIDQRWSGIMGVGPQKKPIIKQLSSHVYCGIRLGGMGIAIGSSVGKELAELA